MNTLLRIFIILVVTTIIGGLMYAGVGASDSTAGFGDFEEGEGRPRPPQGGEYDREGEFRPEGEHGERGGFGFPGGMLKAVVLMTMAGGIYSLIAWSGKRAKKISTSS